MKINQKKAGVALSYVSEIIKILSGLIYTPIMLRILGKSEYGLYQLVYSVVSYLSLLSLGFGSSYMRFYSRFKAKKDEDGIAKLNGMFMVIFLSISVICILCGSVMVVNIRSIFRKSLTDAEYETARILMMLMIVNLALTFPNSVFGCTITANERFFFQKLLIVLQNLLNPFLTLPLLLMGYGSVGMVCVTTLLTFLVLCVNVYYSIKRLNTRFIFKGFEFGLLKEMWVFTFFIFLNQIIDQVNWSVDKFLLGRNIGTASVAVYGIGGQINTMYLQFSTSISNVFVPKVNRIVAESDDNNELTSLFTKIGRLQFIVMCLITSGFAFFGREFIKFWAGKGYEGAYYVTLLLIGPVTIPLIQNIGIEIQRAKNKHKTRSVVYFFIAISNIFVSIPLIKRFGPVGAAAGTAFALFIGNILFMNWYYHNRIGINIKYFWKEIAKFIPALILPVIVGCIIAKTIDLYKLPYFALGIVVYALIYAVSMYCFGMNEYEKSLIKGISNKIVKR